MLRSFLNLDRAVKRLAANYSLSRYGWAREAATGKIERQGRKVVIRHGADAQGFECGSSGLRVQRELQEAGFCAELLLLSIPVLEESPYQHLLTRVELAEGATLVGFTPFERLIGIEPRKIMDPEEIESFEKRFRAVECRSPLESIAKDLVLNDEDRGDFYYPFSANWDDGELTLTEVSYQTGMHGSKMILRASQLGFDPQRCKIERLNHLSFILCFPDFQAGPPVSSDQAEEILDRGERWRVAAAGQPNRMDIHARLNSAVERDWPAFANLANKIAEIYQDNAR